MLALWTGRLAWRSRIQRLTRLILAGFGLTVLGAGALPCPARAQASGGASIDSTADAGEADAVEPKRRLVKWNEYDGPVSTLRFGLGFLTDFSAVSQDDDSKQQVSGKFNDVQLRDFRLIFKGKFKTKRPFSWTLGYMYDGADHSWRFRQTGIQVSFPELRGRVFVGRTKEGFSMNKVMVGYHPWMIERTNTLDAFVPILADGVKWMGYHPRSRIFYSLGWFGDALAEDEKFATYDDQIVGRVAWQAILSEGDKKVLHLGVMYRDAHPDEGALTVRSRPEDYLTPYFIDTGKITSDHASTTGVEVYYRSGSWAFGSEYDWQSMDAPNGEEPLFHGGVAAVSWLVTGETRGYNAPGAFFEAVSPEKSVFEGGRGAWEAVLNYSYADFDDGSFQGGKLWRVTPMVNWHLSDNFRLEFAYGVSVLDRFGIQGTTQFFQSRIQTTL